jgi:hypothetical protein
MALPSKRFKQFTRGDETTTNKQRIKISKISKGFSIENLA